MPKSTTLTRNEKRKRNVMKRGAAIRKQADNKQIIRIHRNNTFVRSIQPFDQESCRPDPSTPRTTPVRKRSREERRNYHNYYYHNVRKRKQQCSKEEEIIIQPKKRMRRNECVIDEFQHKDKLRRKQRRDNSKKSTSVSDLLSTKKMETERLKRAKRRQKRLDLENESRVQQYLKDIEFLTKSQKIQVIRDFESQTAAICHKRCRVCRQVRLNLPLHTESKKDLCSSCGRRGFVSSDALVKSIGRLPVWIDENDNYHYKVPSELQDLTIGEKCLIQLVSPLVPLAHLSNGVLGLRGHVCAFPQNVREVVTELPRLPKDTTVIEVMKSTANELTQNNTGTTATKIYKIRRKKVMDALWWLKKYHRDYRDDDSLIIREDNLDWMQGDEDDLASVVRIEVDPKDELKVDDYDDINEDNGPAEQQAIHPRLDQDGDDIGCIGVLIEDNTPVLSPEDAEVQRILQNTMQRAWTTGDQTTQQNITINWPTIDPTPIDEFDSSNRIFCKAFPWLFPGGYGDFVDFVPEGTKNKHIGQWGEQLLYYEDGRFAKDKFFCFFALNYILRRRNSNSGQYFVQKFNGGNSPDDLEELQNQIEKGNTHFINNLHYFSQNVKGSNPYWLQKRSELYTWINHHVEQRNGAPMFFITLSCAEYFWKDITDLLKDRLALEGNPQPDLKPGTKGYVQLCNDYSIVIQEYFQHRVELFLETVGKEIFGIQHYWIRYEFAPGRGQIHAHLLAISKDDKIFKLMKHDAVLPDGDRLKTERLAHWAKQRIDLTALVSENFDDITQDECKESVSIRFKDLSSMEYDNDVMRLCKMCQCHECSGFCMKENRGGKTRNARRICKAGAGVEQTTGCCDTPGFELLDEPKIGIDKRTKAKKLYMPRNHGRLNQTSLDMLRAWRGNCDVQILIYDSDPDHPDPREIAKVTDYVVGYSTKGNKTLKEEKLQNVHLIKNATTVTGDIRDVQRVARQVLNKSCSNRMISKQECMVLLGGLDLVKCSETIDRISVSNIRKLSRHKQPGKTFVEQYQHRPKGEWGMSLHEYYHYRKNNGVNRSSRDFKCPHYVGINSQPKYPVTEAYARSIITLYKPWKENDLDGGIDWIAEFNHFVNNSGRCPDGVSISYHRILERHLTKMSHYEPTTTPVTHTNQEISPEDQELLDLVNGKTTEGKDAYERLFENAELGMQHSWWKPSSITRVYTDPDRPHEEWLQHKVDLRENNRDDMFDIPRKTNGKYYRAEDLYQDQQEIAAVILDKLDEWLQCEDYTTFEPLRLTVMGAGGTGKSVVINTVLTIVRTIFGRNDVIQCVAPTGTAAANIGGETIHHFLKMQVHSSKSEPQLSDKKLQLLKRRLKHLLAIIIDERSLLDSNTFGSAANIVARTIHGGYNASIPWGGLPILVLLGDDYQLPPVQPGALQRNSAAPKNKMRTYGNILFTEMMNKTMELTLSKRIQAEDQDETKKLNQRVRLGEPTKSDVDKLLSLTLQNMEREHGKKYVENLRDNAMYIFAKNDKIDEHNINKVMQNHSKDNPIALLKCRSANVKGDKAKSSHFDTQQPKTSLMIRDARVVLQGKNFCPTWGLHNGACGVVQEMVFEERHNPNHGSLPKYVVVHFPTYSGPVWDKNNPKAVPIPIVTVPCRYNNCCSRTFVPLELAYARSIHKFQGMSVGVTPPGSPPNMYEMIICDPDEKRFEGMWPGLLYTILSRGTTLGDDKGHGSAVYFDTPIVGSVPITKERFENLLYKTNTRRYYETVLRRNEYVAQLKQHLYRHPDSPRQIHLKLSRMQDMKVSKYSLDRKLHEYTRLLHEYQLVA